MPAFNSLCPFMYAFGWPGGTEMIVILILGVIIFGRRLPEVGRSLGRGIVEFKKGIKGVEDEIENASTLPTPNPAPDALPRSSTPQELPNVSVGGEEQNPYQPVEQNDPQQEKSS